MAGWKENNNTFFNKNKGVMFGKLKLSNIVADLLHVECMCGNVIKISIKTLKKNGNHSQGRYLSCGRSCTVGYAEAWLKLNKARQFNYFTILRHDTSKNVIARCVCGNEHSRKLMRLIAGSPKSCGCKNISVSKKTCLERYGVDNFHKNEAAVAEMKKRSMDKYGVEHALQRKDVRDKIEKTNLKKYGFKAAISNSNVRDKVNKTNLDKYGAENPFASAEIKEKIKNTNLDRYGVENPAQNKDIKAKITKTTIQRYGVDNAFKNKEIQDRITKIKIDNGNIITVNGMTLSDIAKQSTRCKSNITKLSHFTSDMDILTQKKHTAIEALIKKLLDRLHIDYIYDKKLHSFQPDFRIDSHRLVIEADGEYWHTEGSKNTKQGSTGKTYHQDRLKNAEDNGYTLIAFHGNEIKYQLNIVESIIKNKLGMSTKIGARKTEIREVPTKEAAQFFQDNHLMGKGSGKAFGLYYDNVLVTCIRTVKKRDGLDISRFAHVLNTNVVGGFSKLLKHIERTLKPAFIQTFIDRRYGQGFYLEGLGFTKETESISFKWYHKDKMHHRMTFKGTTGCDVGAKRIWDAGQAKWVKYII